MSSYSYSEANFQTDIRQLFSISTAIDDTWELLESFSPTHSFYLRKQTKQSVQLVDPITTADEQVDEFNFQPIQEESSTSIKASNSTILLYDFHVLYQPNYGVPVLCFNAYKSNGSMLTLTEAWTLFDRHYLSADNASQQQQQVMSSILTEMDHPILFRPFLTLHPCRTAELLQSLPASTNQVISFLSTIGPAVNLRLDPQYGKMPSTQN